MSAIEKPLVGGGNGRNHSLNGRTWLVSRKMFQRAGPVDKPMPFVLKPIHRPWNIQMSRMIPLISSLIEWVFDRSNQSFYSA
jgi:hypothetical protein